MTELRYWVWSTLRNKLLAFRDDLETKAGSPISVRLIAPAKLLPTAEGRAGAAA